MFLAIFFQALKILKNSDLKPYFIFVCPPQLDRLRQQRTEAGDLLKVKLYCTNGKEYRPFLLAPFHHLRWRVVGCIPRKFKGGICCGGHLAVTYGGELLYLQIFS